jgi:hypothetical protein
LAKEVGPLLTNSSFTMVPRTNITLFLLCGKRNKLGK